MGAHVFLIPFYEHILISLIQFRTDLTEGIMNKSKNLINYFKKSKCC